MKLLGSAESKITKDNRQDYHNDYRQDSRVLDTFVPDKAFGSLLEISPRNHIILKAFNSEFQEIKLE